MSSDSKIDRALRRITADSRTTVWDISLYTAILHCWHENEFKTPFYITRSELMKFSHIGSVVTYHKCIKRLIEYGYIRYFSSHNHRVRSSIFLQIG